MNHDGEAEFLPLGVLGKDREAPPSSFPARKGCGIVIVVSLRVFS